MLIFAPGGHCPPYPSQKKVQDVGQDILEIGAEIEAFTQGMSFTDFRQDMRTIKAVLYNVATNPNVNHWFTFFNV